MAIPKMTLVLLFALIKGCCSEQQEVDILEQVSNTLNQMANMQSQMADNQILIINTLNQIANAQTQMINIQTEMANSFNQGVSLLQNQDCQLENNASPELPTVISPSDTSDPTTSIPYETTQYETTSVQTTKHNCDEDYLLENSPTDCSDIAALGCTINQTYAITPLNALESVNVYCDMDTDGGSWTVFQRRLNGALSFYRGWSAYEQGFGTPDGEHWMGLRQIRQLTKTGKWTLRIELEDFDGDTAYAKYESFSIGDAASNYVLSIGEYSGTAGDSLAYHNNFPFTTSDRDNDTPTGFNCARAAGGAWWYDWCYYANLNGQYLGPSGTYQTGMVWRDWKGFQSLKKSEMKMRRVQ